MKLFVYGSLCKSKKLNYIMTDARYLGLFRTTEEYYMIGLRSGAYPFITDEQLNPTCKKAFVHGELYEVSEELLAKIDELEGHPHNYTRTRIQITDGEMVQEVDAYILINKSMKEDIAENFDMRFIALTDGHF